MKNRPRMINKPKHNYSIVNNYIEQLGVSLSYVFMGVIEGKTEEFECKTQKMNNLYNFLQEEKMKWNTEEDTNELIDLAKKTGYIFEAAQTIPFSQYLYLAEINPKKKMKSYELMNLKAYLQVGFCIVGVWTDSVLKKHYRFSKAKRKELFDHIVEWVDSYQKGYLNNSLVNEQFKEDIKWDATKGEAVEQEV